MAARHNNAELRRQALRLHDAGIGCVKGAQLLGIAKTTFRWYVLHRDDLEPLPHPYAIDALGERVSLPPGIVLYRCRCGGRALEPEGHPRCREAA